MAILFNIIIVAAAGLIAYWWANQGFLSALFHFLCVAAAGAIAFAFWEVITVKYLLRGGGFDEYAWGTSLLAVFLASLFVLRLAFDRVVPDNLNLPTWMNYTFGGIFGGAAGILTVGIVMIGGGFMQSTAEMVGYRGVVRDAQFAGQPGSTGTLYPPMHEWTASFYTTLSNGALAPTFSRTSLHRSYPDLADMAMSLHRDAAYGGEAKTSITDDAVDVQEIARIDEVSLGKNSPRGAYTVKVAINRSGYDRGEQLVLSASQVRLIGVNEAGKAVAVHPTMWTQETEKSGVVDLAFDDVTNYATSAPGRETTTLLLHFPAAPLAGATPEFIQIKGLRFRLPGEPKKLSQAEWMIAKATLGGAAADTGGTAVAFDPNAPFIEDGEILINNNISPLNLSKNMVSGMDVTDDGFLASGRSEFDKSTPFNPGRLLRIKGIVQIPGTRLVKVNVSRGKSTIDIFNDTNTFRQQAGEGAAPMLVDSKGRTYTAIGYFWIKPDKVEIKIEPTKGIRTVADVPSLPSAGTHELYLLFRVTEGVNIIGFKLGDKVTVANCDLKIGDPEPSGQRGSLTVPSS